MAKSVLARETLCALRTEISRLEGEKTSSLMRRARGEAGWQHEDDRSLPIRTGAEHLDSVLGGGLDPAALYEIRSTQTRDNGAASAFALTLGQLAVRERRKRQSQVPRLLWISDRVGAGETGRPYGPGLLTHGLSQGTLVHAAPRHLADALQIAEAALSVTSFAAVIMEIYGNPRGYGLRESRRLHLRAKAYGRPFLLLRERGEEEASSALLRFRVEPLPSASEILPDGRSFADSIGRPAFALAIEKSRNPAQPQFFLEWNADDCLLSELDRNAVFADGRDAHSRAAFSPSSHRQDREDALGQVVAFGRAS